MNGWMVCEGKKLRKESSLSRRTVGKIKKGVSKWILLQIWPWNVVHWYELLLNALHIPKPYNEDTYGIRIVDAKYIAHLCKNNYEAYRKLISTDMLGIDDLGTGPSEVLDYGNVYTPVIDLLTKSYEEQLFTIITTNLTPQQIREHYGDRIADRLNEMVKKIVFSNGTYRTDKLATPG